MVQMDQQHQQQILKLEQELSKVIAAEEFFSHASGRLIVDLISAEITKFTRDITSSKYEKDHSGYIKALADLHAHRNLLRRLQAYATPEVRDRLEADLKERKNG